MALCISPMSIPRPGGCSTKDRITIPCGKCYACLSNKRNEWSFRIQEEFKVSFTSWFLTITYDELSLPLKQDVPSLCKRDIQKFIKRLRYEQEMVYIRCKDMINIPKCYRTLHQIRYFLCAEYGSRTGRPHYHMILFNLHPTLKDKLEDIWGMGYIDIGMVEQASIHYVTKYLINVKEGGEVREQPFILMSKKPPLGESYIKRAGWYHKNNKEFSVVFNNGMKANLPRIFKERIFNIKEKEEHQKEIEQHYDIAYNRNIEKMGHRYFGNELAAKQATIRKLNKTNLKGKL